MPLKAGSALETMHLDICPVDALLELVADGSEVSARLSA